MTWYEYMISAAQESKDNARQWFRYLRKVIFPDTSKLTDEDLSKLLNTPELSDFQKVTLKLAMNKATGTHQYVISLNQKRKVKSLEQLLNGKK
jgi:uncharacterized protein YwgA